MECEGPLPLGPYNADIEMTTSTLNPDSTPASLVFAGNFGQQEYIISLDDLCDNAGFYCDDGGPLQSGNVNYAFYVPELALDYHDLCTRSCRCVDVQQAGFNTVKM